MTNSLLAQGGHNYRALTHGEKVAEHGSQYETLKTWFGKHSPVSAPAAGRITKAKG